MSIFSSVKVNRPKRNLFDLGHERKMSLNMGDLVPILCQETVPGDSFRLNSEVFIRLAPMLAPIMHKVNVYTHFFFVPNRLVFNKWEEFITGGKDGLDSTPYPMMPAGALQSRFLENGTLIDYMGLPEMFDPDTGSIAPVTFSALPFRAYQMIYNEYYRDQNLQEEVVFGLGSTFLQNDYANLFELRKRCWEKDYFTSALPWAQRGADVMLPFSGEANVKLKDNPTGYPTIVGDDRVQQLGWVENIDNGSTYDGLAVNPDGVTGTGNLKFPSLLDPRGSLEADLSTATSTTINELRRSIRLQEWLEKNARAGSRYIEQIYSHFGVKSSDARLQRPEYLGGGKSPVTVSEVLQMSSTDDVTPQGNMSGHGIAVGNTHSFKKFFEEHGFVIGIMSVLPRTSYQQGIPRQFSKPDKFDYFFPEFAHLGEQPILNKELYVADVPADNDAVFGYTPRYAEYKYCNSSVHGDFRTTLAYWHMGRKFTTRPNLNAEFVSSSPTHDIFAVTDPSDHKLYCHIYNNLKAIRPMPKFGTPTL